MDAGIHFLLQHGYSLLFNTLGAVLWAGSFILLGYVFSGQLERILQLIAHLGNGLLLLVAALIAYAGFKYLQRWRFLRSLRTARIRPEEVKEKLGAGEDLVILDLRHPLDAEIEPRTLPGAVRLSSEELEERRHEIPTDRDIVLYCNCPDEATSARAALQLKRHGIGRVRPLAGGFAAWAREGFPLSSARPGE